MSEDFLTVLVMSLSLVVISLFFVAHPSLPYNNSPFVFQTSFEVPALDDENGWREYIRKKGGRDAYENFAVSIDGFREEVQHNFVHVFGGALYKEEGLDGLSVCDSRFFYGCFHEFTARATEERGVESAKNLNQVCLDTFDGNEEQSCQHGLGHGIQVFYGYTKEDLNNSLEDCRGLPYNSLQGGGCFGGIFMEYNLRTMLADDGRVRSSENTFSPCDSVKKDFRSACVYWQAQWWRSGPLSYIDELKDIYKEMGTYCREMIPSISESKEENKKLRKLCFEGIGGISAPDAEFDPEYTAELCDVATEGEEELALCRASAAYRMNESPDIETALKVCRGLSGETLLYCESWARNDFARGYEIAEELDI